MRGKAFLIQVSCLGMLTHHVYITGVLNHIFQQAGTCAEEMPPCFPKGPCYPCVYKTQRKCRPQSLPFFLTSGSAYLCNVVHYFDTDIPLPKPSETCSLCTRASPSLFARFGLLFFRSVIVRLKANLNYRETSPKWT